MGNNPNPDIAQIQFLASVDQIQLLTQYLEKPPQIP